MAALRRDFDVVIEIHLEFEAQIVVALGSGGRCIGGHLGLGLELGFDLDFFEFELGFRCGRRRGRRRVGCRSTRARQRCCGLFVAGCDPAPQGFEAYRIVSRHQESTGLYPGLDRG